MRYIKEFKNYKINEGKYTEDDIIKCIDSKGYILVKQLKDEPNHSIKTACYPQNIEGNLVELNIDGNIKYANIDDISEIYYAPKNTDLEI